MKTFTILLLTSILPYSLLHADDNITASGSMKDGDTLVSSGGSFEMGFFSPGNSSNRYVGIWYNNIPDFTVVWVANRQVPVTNNSAVLKLNVHPLPGYLLLVDATNDSNTIWSSPPPNNTSRVARNPVLQLLDTGNLVVREEDDPNEDNFYWQSFDYPTDTLLPRMRIGKNLQTGIEKYLTSWKSSDDPAPGDYTFHCDPTGYPQLLMRNKSVEYFRLGSWNGLQLSGLPAARVPANNIVSYGIVIEEREIYYGFDIVNTTSLSRLVVSNDGTAERWWWVSGAKNWTHYLTIPEDPCDAYALCGAYSTCTVVCECLKLPDTKSSWYNESMMPDGCEAACLNDCSCMAYATLDVKAGTGCLFWRGDLIDMKELTGSDQDIYVRMAFTDSGNSLRKYANN